MSKTNNEKHPLRKALWQETVKQAEATPLDRAMSTVHNDVRSGKQVVDAACALKLLQEVLDLRAKVEPQNGDHAQIVHALERARIRLQTNADELHDARDYRAEFLSEDAKRMEEAIAILTKPKLSCGAWGVSRLADNAQALLVSLRGVPTDDDLRKLHELIGSHAP